MPGLTVLSHNAFWFQGAPFEPEVPGPPVPEVLERLLDLYRAQRPDVVCLQEVQDEALFRKVGDALGMEGTFCPGCVHAQYGGAVYWRDGRLLADARDADVAPQRMWQVVEVQANGTVWTLANLHLASSRQLGTEAAACSRIDDLASMFASQHCPQLIAGDFNEGPTGSASYYLIQQGYLDTAVLTGHTIESTGIGKDRSDQIWLHEPAAQWISAFEIIHWERLEFATNGKRWLSDHLPLVVTLER